MKHKWILLCIGCALIACKKTTVDFSYSPTEPRAGQSVSFSNLATDGEKWAWSFGDGGTSTSKSPYHTYKQPGTYTVTLKVDEKKSLTKVKSVTVYDTVPNFTCSDTAAIPIFHDVTFTAQVYNPYSKSVSYAWSIGSNRLYTQLSETNTAATYSVYFEQASSNPETVRLVVVLDTDTFTVEHTYQITDTATNAMLFRVGEKDYAQRIFGTRYEAPAPTTNAEQVALLAAAQDSVQVYNDSTFTLANLSSVFPSIEGFRIANRKIYYRAGGLYVANLNGANRVQIESQPTQAVAVDVVNNRLYWAVADSVLYLPLINTENNRYTATPVTINRLGGVTKIAADNKER